MWLNADTKMGITGRRYICNVDFAKSTDCSVMNIVEPGEWSHPNDIVYAPYLPLTNVQTIGNCFKVGFNYKPRKFKVKLA